MTRVTRSKLLTVLTLGALMAAPFFAQAQNSITTKAVAVPLKEAQEAIGKKQWDVALPAIRKAQAVEKKTPFEAYQIDEFLGYVLVQQKKYSEAAPVYERTVNSGLMPAEQVGDRMKTLATLYFQVKNYPKAVEWARKALDKQPNQEDMGVLIAQSYYLQDDFTNAASSMDRVVKSAERAGRRPQESWLQIVLSSHFKVNNKDGVAAALKDMVRYYPNAEYWENLLDIYRRRNTNDDPLVLGYYRLMADVGALKDKGDIVEMAQLAMDLGVPGEAEQIVEQNMESGKLKAADKTEQGRYDRLLSIAKKQATSDRASLDQLAKEAEKATQGQADIALAHAYLSYGRYDEAIVAAQRGLKKGGVKDIDEAQVLLGIAHLKKGQKDSARQAFRAVKNDSKWNELSSLWVIRTYA